MILILGQHNIMRYIFFLRPGLRSGNSSLDAPLKDVRSLLHPCASIPDGPTYPVMFIVAERMTLASTAI